VPFLLRIPGRRAKDPVGSLVQVRAEFARHG
jgi:hypothetical protein